MNKFFITRRINCYIVALLLMLTHNAFATNFDPLNIIIPQQQKLLDQEKTNREIDEFIEWEKRVEKEHKEQTTPDTDLNQECFRIKEVILDGNTTLSKNDIFKITNQYYNACANVKNISELVNKFNILYKNKGYITTQVYIKQQNIKSGILTLNVVEGRVEEVKFGNNTTADKMTSYFITPLSKGDILNVKAIDQTSENLNYISSYKYKTNVEAGSRPGLSKVHITGNKTFPITPYVETDTIGQEYTGHNRYTFGSIIYNPLKLGDSLHLKYVSTYNNSYDGKYSRSYIGSWSMPIKWARIGINSSYSTYLATIQGQIQTFRSSGKLSNNSFFAQATIFRNKYMKTNITSSLNLIETKNYINEAFSQVQSRNLSNVEFGVMNNLYTKFGGFFHKLTYVRGLSAFGAQKDLPNAVYHAQFDAIRFYHLYNIRTDKIFNGKLPFTFQNVIDAQYSWQDVYSQNQFVLGGFYSVRGFRDVNIFASKGVLVRNDLDFNLIDYVKPVNKLTQILTNNGQGGLTLGAFFDIGHAASYKHNALVASGTGAGTLSSGNYGSMAGAGYKIGYISKYLQTSLVVAHSIKYPDYLTQSVKANDNRVIYLTVRGVW